MTPYILLLGGCLAGGLPALQRTEHQRYFLLVMGIACWLTASLRYVIGFDYRFYEAVFQTATDSGLSALASLDWAEPGYLLLNLSVAKLGGNYRVFLFIFHAIFTVSLFTWIDRYSSAPWLSVTLFLTLQYFALSMNFLRQALALAVIVWIYPFLKTHRPLPCCVIVLLAACFHRTALILMPLCFLLLLRSSRLHYGLAALAAGAAWLLMDPLVELALTVFPKYRHYLEEVYWQGNSFLYILMPVGCFLFCLPLLGKAQDNPPILVNSAFYAMLFQLFITKHFILERLSIYVAVFSILALPKAIQGKWSRAQTGLLLAGCLAYFLFAVSEGFHGVYPFYGIWDRALAIP